MPASQRLAFTTQQRQILRLLAAKVREPEIANILGLKVRTVELQRTRLMQRLNAESIPALVREASRRHVIKE